MGKELFQIAEVIYKFIALNVIWIIFFVLGLGIFGFMPATVALFRIHREWLKGEKDISLFPSYFKYYKEEFIRSNIIGLVFIPILYILYVNYSFVSYFYDESIHLYLYIIIFSIGAIVLMTFVNVFSIMAHFQYKTFHYIKAAFGLVFASPFSTVMQLIWLLAYYLIAINFPKVFVAIGVSVIAFLLMQINYTVFKKHNAV